ncbi:MAG: hypothetical protein IT176_09620 [Acidobacteria bacterium]|nr:hypothetical protein [Acidobacteriota bacterium]
MTFSVDVWLRGDDFAITAAIDRVEAAPRSWTDDDVEVVLEEMLRSMRRARYPGEPERAVALRGLSWIVNPFEGGGVVIAIEIALGAVVAGPFDIEQPVLEQMIARVLARPLAPPASTAVH